MPFNRNNSFYCQVVKFSIYDWDGNSHTVDAHDYLGSLECSLGEVVAAPNKKVQG